MRRKNVLFALIVAPAVALYAADNPSCSRQDQDLLECPAVSAPRVTELQDGFVELAFTVLRDGSVSDIQVIHAGGDTRWVEAAKDTLSRWKFRPLARVTQKTQRFVFEFEG